MLCHPHASPSIESPGDVRLVVLGALSDPASHRRESSVRAFLRAHEAYIKNTMRTRPHKLEFDLVCKKMLAPQRSGKIRDKRKLLEELRVGDDGRVRPLATVLDQLSCASGPGPDVAEDDCRAAVTVANTPGPSSDYFSRSSGSSSSNIVAYQCHSNSNSNRISHQQQQQHNRYQYLHGNSNSNKDNSSTNESSSGVSSTSFEEELPSRSFTMRTVYGGEQRRSSRRAHGERRTDRPAQKRVLSIDDLIDRHSKRLKEKS